MDQFLQLIGNSQFIQFLSTFGLAVLLVLWFVFVRDPKREKFFRTQYEQVLVDYRKRYEQLSNNYKQLSKSCTKLAEDLQPDTRKMSPEQANALACIGLDRDLYKLFYYTCEKLEERDQQDVKTRYCQMLWMG